MVAVRLGAWRAAALAAVAATAATPGVAGLSKESWSAWLRSWSPGSSYGKARGSAGGLAVALPAGVRSVPAHPCAVASCLQLATRAGPRDGCGRVDRLRGALAWLLQPGALRTRDWRGAPQADACERVCALRPSLAAAALHPQTRCHPPRALPIPRHLAADRPPG